jgi:hypothetical protein
LFNVSFDNDLIPARSSGKNNPHAAWYDFSFHKKINFGPESRDGIALLMSPNPERDVSNVVI